MFCPRCATENDLEQAYCRQCGQPLSDVRLGLQGALSESVGKLRSGSEVINGGVATLSVFILIATLIAILGIVLGHPVLSAIAMLNAVVGALIGLPLIMVGKSRVKEATRLLTGKTDIQTIDAQLRSDRTGIGRQSELESFPPINSITEHTTRELQGEHKH